MMRQRKRSEPYAAAAGFTLLELMIVVAIIAVLASIGVPAYFEQVAKGARADAFANMNTIAQSLERWYSLRNTYEGYVLNGQESHSPPTGTPKYNISVDLAPGFFTLSAQPTGPHVHDRCGTLTLDNTGQRTAGAEGCY